MAPSPSDVPPSDVPPSDVPPDSLPDAAPDSMVGGGSAPSHGGVDLAPRAVTPARPRTRRRWLPLLLLAGVVIAGGVFVAQFLTSAVDYYCNVDELGQRKGCDADRRLRVQGVVEQGSIHTQGAMTDFEIGFNGSTIAVTYDGEPGGIFKECVPVVVHGELDSTSGIFRGDRVEVKHSDTYVAENDERIAETDQISDACESADEVSA